MEIDGQRVEIVALKTSLDNALDEVRRLERETAELTAASVDRDSRLVAQSAAFFQKEAAIDQKDVEVATLRAQVTQLDTRLAEALKDGAAFEVAQSELEKRLMTLADDLRKREVALAERDGRLAFANGRAAELTNEIARLKAGSQQALADLGRTVAAAVPGKEAADGQIDVLKAERLRLQAELANLKRDARNTWLAIDSENQTLRREIGRVAAAIAREAALRKANGAPALVGMVPANDEGGLPDLPLRGVDEVEERADAPPA